MEGGGRAKKTKRVGRRKDEDVLELSDGPVGPPGFPQLVIVGRLGGLLGRLEHFWTFSWTDGAPREIQLGPLITLESIVVIVVGGIVVVSAAPSLSSR